LRADLANGIITADEYAKRAEQLHNTPPAKPSKSLAPLEAKVPHTWEIPNPPVDGIDLTDTAPGYYDPAHEEEFLLAWDASLAEAADNSDSLDDPSRFPHPPTQPLPSEKDLTVRNPDSVYNWLRKNQPQVFLQDKDAPHPENASEKPARAANASGRLKRQSNVGTPGPKTDHDEDDAPVPENGKGKGRKSKGGAGDGEEDGAYRPKGGSSRPSKRKREDGDAPPTKGRKKNRASTGVAS
jgi:hypothetical protein